MMNIRRMLPVLLVLLMAVAGCTATGNGVVQRQSGERAAQGKRTAPAKAKAQERFFIEIGVAGKDSIDGQALRGDISGGSVFDDTTLARLKRGLSRSFAKWEGHYNIGLFYMSRGEFELAEKSLHKAMEFKGSPPVIYNALGTLYESMGNQEKALDLFKSALDFKKTSLTPLVMMNIANTYTGMGELEKAEGYFRKADKTGISQGAVFNYNFSIYLYKAEQYDKALGRIERTIKAGREDYLVRYTKASILIKLNRFNEALEIFGKLKGEHPGDARLYKNMGVIYELYTGDMARALQNYIGYIGIVGEQDAGAVPLWADVVRARISRKGGSAAGKGGSQ